MQPALQVVDLGGGGGSLEESGILLGGVFYSWEASH